MNTEFLTIEGTVLKRCAKEATGKIVIPDGVTEISYAAFNDCSSLTEIVIPESVTWIGDSAFGGCSSLKKVSIPERFKEREAEIFREHTAEITYY